MNGVSCAVEKEISNNKPTSNKKALYEQMIDNIIAIIKERKLKPHDPIRSEGELARLFGVSRMTSKLALQALAKDGLVYRMARRGTFLSDQGNEFDNFEMKKNDTVPIHSNEKTQVLSQATRSHCIAVVVPPIDDY